MKCVSVIAVPLGYRGYRSASASKGVRTQVLNSIFVFVLGIYKNFLRFGVRAGFQFNSVDISVSWIHVFRRVARISAFKE